MDPTSLSFTDAGIVSFVFPTPHSVRALSADSHSEFVSLNSKHCFGTLAHSSTGTTSMEVRLVYLCSAWLCPAPQTDSLRVRFVSEAFCLSSFVRFRNCASQAFCSFAGPNAPFGVSGALAADQGQVLHGSRASTVELLVQPCAFEGAQLLLFSLLRI